jgi:hypothetical protein
VATINRRLSVPDQHFSGNGDGRFAFYAGASSDGAWGMALQSDGKIVVAGTTLNDPEPGESLAVVARVNPDGTMDSSFGTDGIIKIDFTDQNLYLWRTLRWGGHGCSFLGSSTRGGTAPVCVAFSNPPITPCNLFTQKYGGFRVYAFYTGSRSFTYRGFS